MAQIKRWLEPFPWSVVTAQNEALCSGKGAFHGPTSDGHNDTQKLWEETHLKETTLSEMITFLRLCHRKAPFCFYNGNTFASLALLIVRKLNLDPEQAFLIRSLAGHIVAGVSTGEEEKAFQEFSDSLE